MGCVAQVIFIAAGASKASLFQEAFVAEPHGEYMFS